MGMTYLFKSAFQDALREFELSFSLGATSQDANIMGLASLGKANVYYRLKDLRMALRLVNQSLQSFTRSNDQLSIADAYKVKGMIHREMRKFAFAESYLQTSLRMNSELRNHLNTGETYFEIGLLERKRGRADEAALAFGKALTYFRKVGAASDVARTTDQIQRPRKGTT
jgi:tetratricopeptide (TPR) repeat protein